MRYLVVLLLAASCNCFTPVDELDGGAGGGANGGGSAGGGSTGGGGGSGGGSATGGGAGTGGGTASSLDGGCTTVAQCSGARTSVPFCGPAGGAGWSCIANACLWECNGGRVCSVTSTPDGGCLTCGAMTSCRLRSCQGFTRSGEVESSNCNLAGEVIVSGSDCRHVLSGDAGLSGTLDFQEGGGMLADLPALGGTCTGAFLPTGLERWVLNCPQCQLVVRF